MRCAVFGCNNDTDKKICHKGEDTKFFRFPKDENLSALWKLNCKRADKFNVKFSRICSLHFKETDYQRNLKCELLNYKPKCVRLLKEDAVPSVLIPSECSKPTHNVRVNRIKKQEMIQNILNRENKIMCQLCQKEYSDMHSKNEHMQKFHPKVSEQPKPTTRRIICPLCCSKSENFNSHITFRKHLLDIHNVNVKLSSLIFKNFDEFAIWKSLDNREVNYSWVRTKTYANGEKKILYCCIKTDSQGIISNCTKSNQNRDSIDINEVCPSRIEIRILSNGEVLVEFVETHVGHEDKAEVKRQDENISIDLKRNRSEITSVQVGNSCNPNIEESANTQHTTTILEIKHKIFKNTDYLCNMLDQHQLVEYLDFLNDKVNQVSKKTRQTTEGIGKKRDNRRKTIPSILRRSKQNGTSKFHS